MDKPCKSYGCTQEAEHPYYSFSSLEGLVGSPGNQTFCLAHHRQQLHELHKVIARFESDTWKTLNVAQKALEEVIGVGDDVGYDVTESPTEGQEED